MSNEIPRRYKYKLKIITPKLQFYIGKIYVYLPIFLCNNIQIRDAAFHL